MILPHGRGQARSLDDGILLKLKNGSRIIPLCRGVSSLGHDVVSEGASARREVRDVKVYFCRGRRPEEKVGKGETAEKTTRAPPPLPRDLTSACRSHKDGPHIMLVTVGVTIAAPAQEQALNV